MLQLACSWLGKLVAGVHVRDADGCMEREGPSVEIFTNGGQCRRLGTWLGSSRVQGFVGEWTRRLYSLPKAIDDVSANAPV